MKNGRNTEVKAFLSIASALAFCALVVSGAALFVAPPCSVAEATKWRFFYMSKESWEAVHVTFACAFVVLAPLHLLYNWKSFVSYFSARAGKSGVLSRPVLAATAAAAALFLLSAFHVPPVSWLHEVHEKIKFSWSRGAGPEGAFRGRGMGKFREDRRDKVRQSP